MKGINGEVCRAWNQQWRVKKLVQMKSEGEDKGLGGRVGYWEPVWGDFDFDFEILKSVFLNNHVPSATSKITSSDLSNFEK